MISVTELDQYRHLCTACDSPVAIKLSARTGTGIGTQSISLHLCWGCAATLAEKLGDVLLDHAHNLHEVDDG